MMGIQEAPVAWHRSAQHGSISEFAHGAIWVMRLLEAVFPKHRALSPDFTSRDPSASVPEEETVQLRPAAGLF